MIDFHNGVIFKLAKSKGPGHLADIQPHLLPDEDVISEYSAVRDYIVFTSKRIIAVNVQGVTGKKQCFTSLPYSRIQAFSVETAGAADLDAQLELFFAGVGRVRFEIDGQNDISEIGRMISRSVLD